MPDVHIYVTKPPEKDVPALRKLSHVSGVEVDSTGSAVAVSFEGERASNRR